MPNHFVLRLTVFLTGVSLILLLPYKTTVVPEWKIRVIDETGRPFAGAIVRQVWDHYSCESRVEKQTAGEA